jgi:very-short-patch-repair endonuclease
VVDFACLRRRVIIEVDGAQHGHDRRREADRARDQALADLGYRVLRFWNHEIDREKRVVLDTIYAALVEPPPPVRRCAPATLP